MTRRSRSSSASTVRARTPRAGPRRSYGTTPLSHSRPSRSPATAGQPQRSPPTSSNPASAPPATLDVREPPPGHGAARSLRVAATVLVAAGVAVVLVVQRRRSRRGVRR
jgi:hypothetical protein